MSEKFDIVVYGATGFTGRLATKYLARQYKDSIKWAIAGRNRSKLEALAAEQGAGFPAIIVANSNDEDSLKAMCAKTKVVATAAGPFSRYGTPVVKACVEAGCDYCDITGEVTWVREMVALFDDKARASGSRVVHLCGHDSVPWDLLTMKLAEKLKENGEDLARVDMFDDIKSAPSGGTLETAFGIMFGKKPKKNPAVKALGYDPFLKPRSGDVPSEYGVSNRSVKSVEFARKPGQAHRIFFFMSGVNAAAVKRSNALNHYGKKVVYCEGQSVASKFGALCHILFWMLVGVCLYTPPIRWLLRRFVLPKPGEGPSEASMDNGHLLVTGEAKGSKGGVAKASMSFAVDPGYKDTARMMVESALTLSLEGDKLADSSGGVYTPGACLGQVLLDRLTATGTAFSYHTD